MLPMLSVKIGNLSSVLYPCLVSKHIEGVRCLIVNRVALDEDMQPIKNKYIQSVLGTTEHNGLDGVLVCNDLSNINDELSEPDFVFHVFDDYKLATQPFKTRFVKIPRTLERTEVIPHHFVAYEQALVDLNKKFTKAGYEKIIIRSVHGQYRYGASSKEQNEMMVYKENKEEIKPAISQGLQAAFA